MKALASIGKCRPYRHFGPPSSEPLSTINKKPRNGDSVRSCQQGLPFLGINSVCVPRPAGDSSPIVEEASHDCYRTFVKNVAAPNISKVIWASGINIPDRPDHVRQPMKRRKASLYLGLGDVATGIEDELISWALRVCSDDCQERGNVCNIIKPPGPFLGLSRRRTISNGLIERANVSGLKALPVMTGPQNFYTVWFGTPRLPNSQLPWVTYLQSLGYDLSS